MSDNKVVHQYTMYIETLSGDVMQHPYHLGTILSVAERFVFEKLRLPLVKSVVLRQGAELVRTYDFHDLPEDQQSSEHKARYGA